MKELKLSYKETKGRVVTKEDNDPRRNKKRCKYYSSGNYCEGLFYNVKCVGSTHCKHYKEENNNHTSYVEFKQSIYDYMPYKELLIFNTDDIHMRNILEVVKNKRTFHFYYEFRLSMQKTPYKILIANNKFFRVGDIFYDIVTDSRLISIEEENKLIVDMNIIGLHERYINIKKNYTMVREYKGATYSLNAFVKKENLNKFGLSE